LDRIGSLLFGCGDVGVRGGALTGGGLVGLPRPLDRADLGGGLFVGLVGGAGALAEQEGGPGDDGGAYERGPPH
jgi:hypothetical protein